MSADLERIKRLLAIVLGSTAALVGGFLSLVVAWSAAKAGQPRLLLNGIFPCWALAMGIWGLRYGLRQQS